MKLIDNPSAYADLWKELEYKSQSRSFFQTKECFDFYSQLTCLQAFAYAVVKENKFRAVIVGFLSRETSKIKQYLSARAIIPAGPMLAPDVSDEEVASLMKYVADDLRNKAIYIETRNFFDYKKYIGAFKNAGFDYDRHLNYKIDVSADNYELCINKKSRQRIKIGIQKGAKFITSPTLSQVKEFYDCLQNLYKTKIKTPLFPCEFFEKLYYTRNAHYILVEVENKIIAGVLAVGAEDILYEWYACGDFKNFNNYHPSLLSTYAAIKYAHDNNFKVYDMMGAGVPGKKYGVRDFKSNFGGNLEEYGRFKFIANPVRYAIGCFGIFLMKHF